MISDNFPEDKDSAIEFESTIAVIELSTSPSFSVPRFEPCDDVACCAINVDARYGPVRVLIAMRTFDNGLPLAFFVLIRTFVLILLVPSRVLTQPHWSLERLNS